MVSLICERIRESGYQTYFTLSNSWIKLSLSLKHPKLVIAWRTSGSMASTEGMTWVWTTSIIGNSSSSSPFPPAVTHGCRLISESCKDLKSEADDAMQRETIRDLPWVSSPGSLLSFLWGGSDSPAERSAEYETLPFSLSPATVAGCRRQKAMLPPVGRTVSPRKTRHRPSFRRTFLPVKRWLAVVNLRLVTRHV